MRVIASQTENYRFYPEHWEVPYLSGPLSGLVHKGGGYELSVYEDLPKYTIKGGELMGRHFSKTADAVSETEILSAVGLCVDVEANRVVPQSTIEERSYKRIQRQLGVYVCNHIPQMFYPLDGGRIVAIEGNFDVVSKLFKGQLVVEHASTSRGD